MNADIRPGRLFMGSCITLIATAMTFAVLSSIMRSLQNSFFLSNEDVGWITGAGLWGFPISILIFGPLCSVLGMRFLLRLAYVFFFIGVGVMISATYAPAMAFWLLFFGALTIAFANGLVEGACNPLVATIYPDRKVEKLNQFHVWFPGGIVIGGLLCFALDNLGVGYWQIKVATILIPVCASASIMFAETYPLTERAQSGVSFSGMLKETLTRPLFILLFFCMMMTASVELGPNRWVGAVMDSAGFHGMLILVWTSLLMALMRQFAGSVAGKIAPTGMLLMSSVLSGLGLLWLSYAQSGTSIFLADTVFALGVCYFWPTMLGVASERVPKGGEFALAMLGMAGNLAVGLLTIPMMGRVADNEGHKVFQYEQTCQVIQQVADGLPAFKEKTDNPALKDAIDETVALAKSVLDKAQASKTALPQNDTANVLRGALNCLEPDDALAKTVIATLNPAEAAGGRTSFRYVTVLAGVLVVIFGALYLKDKTKGGYQIEQIET